MSRLRELKRSVEDGLGQPPAMVIGAAAVYYSVLFYVFVPRIWRLIPW